MKKIGHVKLLFTVNNSWPISFGKDSFLNLINVLFISVNEYCAKYSGNKIKVPRKTVDTDF